VRPALLALLLLAVVLPTALIPVSAVAQGSLVGRGNVAVIWTPKTVLQPVRARIRTVLRRLGPKSTQLSG
jgi:hypothetical protein